MRTGQRIAGFVLTAVLAAVATGCQAPAPRTAPAGEAVETSPPASVATTGQVTAESLPLSVGTVWTVAGDAAKKGVPISFSVKGPWALDVGDGATVTQNEIVDPAGLPGIDRFDDYEFVVKSSSASAVEYRVHGLSGDWVTILGSIEGAGNAMRAVVETEPVRFWPLGFDVGDTMLVSEADGYRVEARVLARDTATVPAGVIEGTYLVKFTHTPLGEAIAPPSSYYYLLAPEVGFVAMVVPRTGSEATGFSSANFVQVLASLPRGR